jgi:hypothetical protein
MGQSEIGVESVLEDVLTMPMDRRLGFINWLGSSQDPRATKLLLPLLENQSSKVVTATIDALEQLGAVAAYQSISALNFLLTNSSNRLLKQHARAALGRLTMYLTPGQEVVPAEQSLQKQELLHEARVSFIDGSGTQMVMLAWKRSDGLLKGVNVLYQDTWGIKDCYGTLTPLVLVRIQVPQPNLSFRRFDALVRFNACRRGSRFRKHVKGLAESGNHLPILPSAVR